MPWQVACFQRRPHCVAQTLGDDHLTGARMYFRALTGDIPTSFHGLKNRRGDFRLEIDVGPTERDCWFRGQSQTGAPTKLSATTPSASCSAAEAVQKRRAAGL